VLMAVSLAVTAGGLMVAYLLWNARPVEGKTMNAALLDLVAGGWTVGGMNVGRAFVIVTLVSEGALLFVAAQAGFVDGPRVMANMAVDSWLPNRFSALSDRLTMRNGIMLMGGAALATLLYTKGDITRLVVMYSINVFVTFTLSNVAMIVFWMRRRPRERKWVRRLPAHILAAALCATILLVTVTEKFSEGGWLTLLITAVLIGFCLVVKRHYRRVARAIRRLDTTLPDPLGPAAAPASASSDGESRRPDPKKPVAVLFVGPYGGLGRRALLALTRMFPGHFQGVVFVSIAVADSDVFKGPSELPALEERTRRSLELYERFAATLGLPAASEYAVGTEVAVEAERIATRVAERYPQALAVAGQIVFERDSGWTRLLHNETAFRIQSRLQRRGVPMIVLPVRIDSNGSGEPRTSFLPRESVPSAAPRPQDGRNGTGVG